LQLIFVTDVEILGKDGNPFPVVLESFVPIQLQCPGCGAAVAVSDRSSGRRATCPKCAGKFLVPAVDQPTPMPDSKPAIVSFDEATPSPSSLPTPGSDKLTKVRRRIRKSSKTIPRPLRRPRSGIHPGCILGVLCLLVAVTVAVTYGVYQWKAAGIPDNPHRFDPPDPTRRVAEDD
jgi:DNA-directed RNA polymerase subunit RPC12/RpoP